MARRIPRSATLLGLGVTALVLGAGCGDDDGDEGAVDSFCAAIATASGDIAFDTGSEIADALSFFLPLQREAPPEIEDDVDTIVESLENLQDAFAETDAGTDPDAAFDAAAEAANFNEEGYQQSVDRVETYARDNCDDVGFEDE